MKNFFNRIIFSFIFLHLLQSNHSSAQQDPCIEAMTYVVNADFNTSRKLIQYYENFGLNFQNKLYELMESDLWIDAGSGKSFAIREYLNNYKHPANVIGINATTFSDPSILNEINEFEKKHTEKFKFLNGKFIEDIPSESINNASLITDLFGPFSYSADVTKILNIYLNALKINGEVYVKFISTKNKFIDSNQKEIDLIEYLSKTAEGFTIDFPNQFWGGYPFKNQSLASTIQNTFRIVKNSKTFKVPNLKNTNFKSGSPPERKFSALNHFPENN